MMGRVLYDMAREKGKSCELLPRGRHVLKHWSRRVRFPVIWTGREWCSLLVEREGEISCGLGLGRGGG